MPRRRSTGFTFIELIVAMTVAAVIMGIALPRMAPARDSAGVRSAKQLVTAYVGSARQAAVRRGGSSAFNVSGNEVWVTSTKEGVLTIVEPRINLDDQYDVAISGTLSTVAYNARGLANPRLSGAQTLRLTRGDRTDSLCITLLGMVGKCGL